MEPGQIGERIWAARRAGSNGRILNQAAFFDRCCQVEAKHEPIAENRRFLAIEDSSKKARVIRRIEAGQERLRPRDLLVFARALELPDDHFAELEPFLPLTGPRNGVAGAAHPAPLSPTGFRRIPADSVLPVSRAQLASRLSTALAERRARVVLVEGKAGAGKSFFLSAWFHRFGSGLFGGRALMLDCSSRTVDQVLPDLCRYLSLRPGAPLSQVAAEIDRHGPCLLVLDGLSFRDLQTRRQPDAITLSGLQETVFELAQQTSALTLALGIENNGEQGCEAFVCERLPHELGVHSVRLDPLAPEAGAQFLQALIRSPMPREQLLRLSRHHQGMPLALTVVAAELNRLKDQDRERYVAWIGAGRDIGVDETGSSAFRDVIARYTARLETDRVRRDGPPDGSIVALLKLIALMPGPTPCGHIEHILRMCRIQRLGGMTLDDPRLLDVPFLIRVDDDIDVHALVRRMYRTELDDAVRIGAFASSFTSREELEQIHWRAALLNWGHIRRFADGDQADAVGTSVIEAFVYHMVRLIRLTPPDRRRTKTSGGASAEIIRNFETQVDLLNDNQLWDIAFYRVVRPFLLDRKYESTRVHGQFEAKARILEHLLHATEFGITIAPRHHAEIQKEISVSQMHSGHLKSSRATAEQALSTLIQISPGARNLDHWRALVDIQCVAVAVDVRLGRPPEEILSPLEALASEAEDIVAASVVPEKAPEHAPPRACGGCAGVRAAGRCPSADGRH